MSTIIAPNIETTACGTFNPSTRIEEDQQQHQQETDENLDLIVTFLNMPQTKMIKECQNYTEKVTSPAQQTDNFMEIPPTEVTNITYSNNVEMVEELNPATTDVTESTPSTTITLTTLTNCNFYPEIQTVTQNEQRNDAKNVADPGNDDDPDVDANDEEDSEEEELTNLTWLTELRNQSITWPSTMNPTILDDNTDGNVVSGEDRDIAMDANLAHERVSSGNNPLALKMYNGMNTSGKALANNDAQGRQGQSAGTGKSTAVQTQLKRPTPAERYQIFIDKVKRDLLEYEQSATNYQTDTAEKPPFNYSHIIGMAMLDKGRVTLQQICTWIESKFAFFRVRKKWNNSIRHNLSLHHCFRKINRNKYEKGKGGYWELGVDPKKCDRKRIRNRKSANQKKKLNQQQQNVNSSNSSFDETVMATNSITAGIDAVGHDVQHTEELMLDDLDVQQNIDIRSCSQQQQQHHHLHQQQQQMHSNLEEQLQQEEAFIANVLANCIEIETGTEVAELNNEMPTTTAMLNEPQYQLGTVIISTTAEDVATLNATTTPLGSFIYTNNIGNGSEYCQGQKILYSEDEIPPACENVIVSSFLSDNVEPHSNTPNPHRPNVIVEPLEPYYSVISASATTLVSANGDCTTIAGEHFRPYIDGIDEAFQYLRSMDNNRSEDLLDNLLDISVSDY